ncbi:MAG: hypothetical protein U5M51_06195 [Emticicia sp.]|nr:hypothetical protein [Emticicia sp.]
MKKIVFILSLLTVVSMATLANTGNNNKVIRIGKTHAVAGVIKIKIKNDTDNEVTVYSGSGNSSYRLQKNVITTISMEEGSKLFEYNGGKKGKVLLVVTADMDGKTQLYSKL